MLFAIFMIENFHYALEDLIPIKNETIKKYIPYGAIPTMLTYGQSLVLHLEKAELVDGSEAVLGRPHYTQVGA